MERRPSRARALALLGLALALLAACVPACSRRADETTTASAASRPTGPSAATPTPLGRDGLPVGWLDADLSNVELYYVAPPPGPCPPCPPGAECAPCPPPFHEFAVEPPGAAAASPLWVRFTEKGEALEVGGYYRLAVRKVAWAPHGDVLISVDRRPRKITPKAECDKLRQSFLDRRAQATNRCAKDDDCANAPGGIDDCGQVTDRETADKLFELYAAISRGCGLDRHCAPRRSIPQCKQGRCVQAAGPSDIQGEGIGEVR